MRLWSMRETCFSRRRSAIGRRNSVVYDPELTGTIVLRMFDPSLCGFASAPSTPSSAAPPPPPPAPAVLPQKRSLEALSEAPKQRDDPSLWCGGGIFVKETPTTPATPATPATSAMLMLPPLPLPPPMPPLLPRPQLPPPTEDPRRAAFKCRDPRFPMAGAMREDGGVFAFIDRVSAERRRVPFASTPA